ncbi:hypothetical protein K491DRAFT_685907 [Lophiostoma macrostomum CBS 122681]|uniref:Uncharacterized protein n=1 Tax=Lophiostoma macrostomum CBS 122681 TaxID=1314788 RepID=A0A6A6TTH7_9PLEO|nr:hypothetical protein K491DRAFT_685907 [Lophiostoma macrostomum CBS 122681]
MSALDPSGPSQPTLQQAYETPGNAASKNPSEKATTSANAADDSGPVDQRIPQKQASEDQATSSSLGRGIRGAGTGEEGKGLSEEDVGRHNELDGQQMAAPGEGAVADAVAGRGTKGVGGEQEDLAADLDRKKAEQAEAREKIKQQRAQGVEAGGALGQQGGPANPVDKGGYPN